MPWDAPWTKLQTLKIDGGRATLWRKITENLLFFNHFRHQDEYESSEALEKCSREDGEIVSSKLAGQPLFQLPGDVKHKILLDIDHNALLVPSSTEGHWHLYIDHELPWSKYCALLLALAEAGVIEDGYAQASMRREQTHLRVPWLSKSGAPNGKEHL